MNTITRFLIFLLFVLIPLHINIFSYELVDVRGQEVEDITVEKSGRERIENAEELFRIKDKKTESNLFRDALASDVVGERPDPENVPTKVKVGLFVNDISALDDADQTFTARILFVLRWVDPRLASDSQGIRKLDIDSIWNPLSDIVNVRKVTAKHSESVFVDSEGHVIFFQVYSGTFTVPLDLRNFPFDKHTLYLRVGSFYSPQDVDFIIDEKFTGWADTLSIPDWIVSNGEARINTSFSKVQQRDFAQFEFSFQIQRLLGFYQWKIIMPLALIVFISWGVFWIDPKRLEAQIGLSATTFLTLFAFQFAIAALLPRIAYLTRMDKYTMLCALLVFLTIIKAVITSYYVKREDYRTAKYIDYSARVLFPLAFIGIMVFSFWL